MSRKLWIACSLLLIILLVFASASAQEAGPRPESSSVNDEFVPGEMLVQFRPGVTPPQADNLLKAHGISRKGGIPALRVHLLRLPPGLPVEKAVEIFNRSPEVAYAEPNYLLQIVQASDGWQANQWAPQKIQAPEAWAQISNPVPVVIAVVDTGVDYRHSQLAPNMWANPAEGAGQPGVDDDGNGYIDDLRGWDFVNNDAQPLDDHFHGTHVAGIAAATQSALPNGMAGVCPFCQVMAVKAMDANGSGSLDVVASGITYATNNGARVINLSLGASIGTATLQNAVDYAWSHDVVVVAAAGNNGSNTLIYPAAYPNAMAIAATNSSDYRSCFSNYGSSTNPYVSVAAPGESIYSTVPLDANGLDAYATYSGTSMATPHVAGLAGLLLSQDPARSNAAVRDLIQATAIDLGPLGTDPFFGSGRIDALRSVVDDRSTTIPPAGLFSDSLTASGYAHARKLARDSNGALHLVWHTKDGDQYRVRYATSQDDGASWDIQPDVYSSAFETYHPAMTVDGGYVYAAFPSKTGPSASSYYQILFSRKPLAGGAWSPPVALMGGSYNAVRPDLYLDPVNGRLHLVASSLDDAQYLYYRASSDQGLSWDSLRQVNPSTSTTASNTRYAAVHANGSNVYLAARTVAKSLFTIYYLHTVRSTDGGQTWIDQTKISSYTALLTGEYGVSLAGVGDRLYMGYEVGGGLYFRRYDGAGWSNYQQLETAGAWPSITQAEDGQAWLVWENGDNLLLRHYTGSAWEPAQTVLSGNALNNGNYPNLKLGTSAGRVEWVYTACNGAPFRLVTDGIAAGGGPEPSPTPTNTPTATLTYTPTPTFTPTFTATFTPTDTPTATLTSSPTPTFTPTFTPTDTPTATQTHTPTAMFTPTFTATATATSDPSAMHVGDLDGTGQLYSKYWRSTVTITIHNGNHAPLANATVNAAWSGGITGNGKCTTASNGQCSITSGRIPLQAATVNLTVTKVSRSPYSYLASANHDLEADSNGTVITLNRP
ncbi:MAG TPA: S8 family serine peptidase [Anaerolineales bacterium]|nr:S8 family serine peptidase [Anaerolineales bacterium]